MKFLTSAQTQQELFGLRDLLRDKGVPTLLQDELAPYSKSMLYVLVDSQYNDAFQLMNDPAHEVIEPIDEDTLNALEAQITSNSSLLWASFKPFAIGFCILVFIAAVFLINYVS
jgi:hypothetical protein